MSWTEIVVLYLALGAPICTLYYFEQKSDRSWYARAALSTSWLPVWVFLLSRYFLYRNSEEIVDHKSPGFLIESISKRLDSAFAEIADSVSIFEFRETVERYVGLSLANQTVEANTTRDYNLADNYDFVGISASEINNICLERRNRRLLEFHLDTARGSFLRLVIEHDRQFGENNRVLLFQLFDALQDEKALKLSQSLLGSSSSIFTDGESKAFWEVAGDNERKVTFELLSSSARD